MPVRELVWEPAIDEFLEVGRKQYTKGMDTYHVPLQTFNGRMVFDDALEELVDSVQYLVQAKHEARVAAEVLYAYGHMLDFWTDLPAELQTWILNMVGDTSISEICHNRELGLYATNQHNRNKGLQGRTELGPDFYDKH